MNLEGQHRGDIEGEFIKRQFKCFMEIILKLKPTSGFLARPDTSLDFVFTTWKDEIQAWVAFKAGPANQQSAGNP